MRVKTFTVVLLAAVAYLATGFYVVGPDEQAVVRRLGRVVAEPRLPGLQCDFPWGLSRVDLVKPAETKRLWIGRPSDEVGRDLRRSEFLTGDRNIILIAATVQYHVSDPVAYVLSAARTQRALRAAVESQLAAAVAHNGVDYVRSEGGLEIQDRVLRGAQQIANDYRLGVAISSVTLESVLPPVEVVDAFREANDARNIRDQLIHQAEADERKVIAEARGEAQTTIDQAKIFGNQVVQEAHGSSARFLAMLREYRQGKAVTATRLYLETMERILPRLGGKLIVDPGEDVDLNLLRTNP
jgi:membrane protease subunit HflK